MFSLKQKNYSPYWIFTLLFCLLFLVSCREHGNTEGKTIYVYVESSMVEEILTQLALDLDAEGYTFYQIEMIQQAASLTVYEAGLLNSEEIGKVAPILLEGAALAISNEALGIHSTEERSRILSIIAGSITGSLKGKFSDKRPYVYDIRNQGSITINANRNDELNSTVEVLRELTSAGVRHLDEIGFSKTDMNNVLREMITSIATSLRIAKVHTIDIPSVMQAITKGAVFSLEDAGITEKSDLINSLQAIVSGGIIGLSNASFNLYSAVPAIAEGAIYGLKGTRLDKSEVSHIVAEVRGTIELTLKNFGLNTNEMDEILDYVDDSMKYANNRTFPNTQPLAYDQNIDIFSMDPIPITLEGSDIEGDPLTFVHISYPMQGTLTGTPPNLFYNLVSENFNGLDFFVFKTFDGKVNSKAATINITIDTGGYTSVADDDKPPTNPTNTLGFAGFNSQETLTTGKATNHLNPYFQWSGALDDYSGVAGYWMYFGTDDEADPFQSGKFIYSTTLTVQDEMVSGFTYYLRIKTRDWLGNLSPDTYTGFVYPFDTSEPEPPEIEAFENEDKLKQLINGDWNNFTWNYYQWNEDSNVEGYYVYFGKNRYADPLWEGNYQSDAYISLTYPITNGEQYYLNIKAKSNAGNISSQSITFVAGYDQSAPDNPMQILGFSSEDKNTEIDSNKIYSFEVPLFEFVGAEDLPSGIAGYYVYFGTLPEADPATIMNSFQEEAFYSPKGPLTNNETYYLNIRAVDNAGNIAPDMMNGFIYTYNNGDINPKNRENINSKSSLE